ncbi:MAG: cytochrome c-type biogenesis protein CcmH [Paraglaciecola sp.]|jgi:cytochrome c-type biogenesis protein CcmH
MRVILSTVIFMLSIGFNVQLFATQDKFQLDEPQKTTLFLELTKELRCPKCQNQNIADSDAMIAVDLKRKVHELVKKDYTKQQVIDFMKQRYGDFVYYKPPVNSMTIWLWLLPILFVIAALVSIAMSRKRQSPEINDEQLAKAEAILEHEE